MSKRKAWTRGGAAWFNERADVWMVTVRENGKSKQITLAKGRENRKQADVALGKVRLTQLNPETTRRDETLFIVLADAYLVHVEKQTPASFYRHKLILKSFCKRYPKLRVKDMHSKKVTAWMDENPGWHDGGGRWQAVTVIKAALNWGRREENGPMVHGSYLVGISRPRIKSAGREMVIDQKTFDAYFAGALPWLQDVLTALDQTGERVATLGRIEAREIDFAAGRIVLDPSKHKTGGKTGKPRVIPLTSKLADICKRLALKYPAGPIFRTRNGSAVNSVTVSRALKLIRERDNLPRMLAKGARHTKATRLLEAGESPECVAEILGHASTEMVRRHYGHLILDVDRMRAMMESTALKQGGEAPVSDRPSILPLASAQ